MTDQIKIGFAKIGVIGITSMVEVLLDERSTRDDIKVRVVASGAKMNPEDGREVVEELLKFEPHFVVLVSPNASLDGPKAAAGLLKEKNIPMIVISDKPASKAKEFYAENKQGYVFIGPDSMIGAKKNFLDPKEMSIFNADVIAVLSYTGAMDFVFKSIDSLIEDAKKGELDVTKVQTILSAYKATGAAKYTNPYARAKAMAAYEMATSVGPMNVRACWVIKDPKIVIHTLAAAHEIMGSAAVLAREAREIEKAQDSVVRTPHEKDGSITKRIKLLDD